MSTDDSTDQTTDLHEIAVEAEQQAADVVALVEMLIEAYGDHDHQPRPS